MIQLLDDLLNTDNLLLSYLDGEWLHVGLPIDLNLVRILAERILNHAPHVLVHLQALQQRRFAAHAQ